MSNGQLAFIGKHNINLILDKSLDDDFLADENDIFEGGITFSTSNADKVMCLGKDWLKNHEFSNTEHGVVFKKPTTKLPKYHQGEIVIFGKKSIQFSLSLSNLEGLTSSLGLEDDSKTSLKINAGWKLLSLDELKELLSLNADILKAQLFNYICKQVRERGGRRNENATVSELLFNYDFQFQGLMGIPVASLTKRVYDYQSTDASKFRDLIDSAYKTALKLLISDSLVIEVNTINSIPQYRPLTISELKDMNSELQSEFSEIYGTASIS